MSKSKFGNRYSEQDCIESLQQAAEQLGHSPKIREYKNLDMLPSSSTVKRKFGSWNEAKEAADLESWGAHLKILPIPQGIEISENEWRTFEHDKRFRIHKRAKLDRLKANVGCQKCGFDEHASALHFHHKNPENKECSINRDYTLGNIGWEKTKKEIKKCDILCANCHSIEEMDSKLEYKF